MSLKADRPTLETTKMHLKGDRFRFGAQRGITRPWRVAVLLGLIATGILLTRLVQAGRVEPLFLPTATPTRSAFSYRQEAEAHFSAGDLDQAINAYQRAVLMAPAEAALWAELARVQTYSSALITTAEGRRERLAEARASIDQAVQIDEDSARAWAIRILVYDWSATASADYSERERLLLEASNSSANATRLDPNDPLAVAFDAELWVDQERFEPAIARAEDAIALDQNSMDAYRVYGTVLESNGRYDDAIAAYEKAVEINPNLTFLYLRIGANHRRQGREEQALEFFDKAATINEQLGIQDPIPFQAIGRTYLQQGQFFIAARNLETAVSFAPNDPELLGFLGIIYFKARNYESAEIAFRCAVRGCDTEAQVIALCGELEILDCNLQSPDPRFEGIQALALEPQTLEYFYTYGSVLAYNDQDGSKCRDAEAVFQELMAEFGEDAIVRSIVDEDRAICQGHPVPSP